MDRTAKLFLIGLATQGADFPSVGTAGLDLKTIRVPGILQRIAWVYFVLALMSAYFPKFSGVFSRWSNTDDQNGASPFSSAMRIFKLNVLHWTVASVLMLIYICLMLFLPVPSWSYTTTYSNYTAGTPHNKTNGIITNFVSCDVVGDLGPACSAARLAP